MKRSKNHLERLIPLPKTLIMPLTPIFSVPSYVTPTRYAEITSQTPSSFSDLPTVVRLELVNVAVDLQPALAEFSAEDSKTGTLYLLERYVYFYLPLWIG